MTHSDVRFESFHLLTIEDLPFCIGAQPEPRNPGGLPDVYPFELHLNELTGVLQQRPDSELVEILQRAYGLGVEMGVPSADTEHGRPYVEDFLPFLDRHAPTAGRALEIGAGVGYLSSLLLKRGWSVDSLEPGKGYAGEWSCYGVEVINDFFPSPKARGPYDLIVFFTVLEHMPDADHFLRTAIDHLAPDGALLMVVPDCTEEIEAGDPSMLLHEHYHYFTPASLARTLGGAGLEAAVEVSSYGRSIRAAARRGVVPVAPPDRSELALLRQFPRKLDEFSLAVRRRLEAMSDGASLGVYCPARALAVLPREASHRFFDDAVGLRGKYYPPFRAPIEGREALLTNPPDALWIMSRTFGGRLREELAPQLPDVDMVLPEQFVE